MVCEILRNHGFLLARDERVVGHGLCSMKIVSCPATVVPSRVYRTLPFSKSSMPSLRSEPKNNRASTTTADYGIHCDADGRIAPLGIRGH